MPPGSHSESSSNSQALHGLQVLQWLMVDTPSAAPHRAVALHLLGGPWITVGASTHDVPDGSRRLLAFLALDGRQLERPYVAGVLWPDTDDDHAAGCLRTAVWRLRQAGLAVVAGSKQTLHLAPDVRVDVHEVGAWAQRILSGQPEEGDLRGHWDAVRALDLLPGWYDDWVVRHRERMRQLTLHALDGLSRLLTARGRHGEAVASAQAAVGADPLRESAQRALLAAHVAEGNLAEARKALDVYESLLMRELGAAPDPALYALVGRRPPDPPRRAPASGVIPRHRAPLALTTGPADAVTAG